MSTFLQNPKKCQNALTCINNKKNAIYKGFPEEKGGQVSTLSTIRKSR